jgi:hypothetical protein
MDTVRIVDLLLNHPSTPLALAEDDLEGWEPVKEPPKPAPTERGKRA